MNTLQLRIATRCLQQGGVIAYPTEAVWGLGCDPWNQTAVLRLLSIKKRPVEKGLILVAASLDQIAPIYKNLTRQQQEQLDFTWPGPRTWLIPDPDSWIPMWIKGSHTSVAVRVSDHPLVVQLCRHFGGPIVSTSANTTGKLEIRSRLRLMIALGAKLDYVLPGDLGNADRTTTITDLISGKTVR